MTNRETGEIDKFRKMPENLTGEAWTDGTGEPFRSLLPEDMDVPVFEESGETLTDDLVFEQPFTPPTLDQILQSNRLSPPHPMHCLWSKYQNCQLCALHQQGRSQVVLGAGSLTPKYIFIGEGPGAHEDQKGVPFCGRTGGVLTAGLNKAGINRVTEAYLMNAVCCWPPGNRNPTKHEILACRFRMVEQLSILLTAGTVKVIVLVGKPAYATFMRGSDLLRDSFKIDSIPITRHLGWVPDSLIPEERRGKGPKIYTIYHPSYIARNEHQPAIKAAWEADLDAIKRWADDGAFLQPRKVI